MGGGKRRAKPPIHRSIKESLGYNPENSDADVYKDWNERLRRVCKPCWELKYCPYGPLVEQSPLLPIVRSDKEAALKYYRGCIESGLVGSIVLVTDELREDYERWIDDEYVLMFQAYHELISKNIWDNVDCDNPEEVFEKAGLSSLPPIHLYRVPFDLGGPKDFKEEDFEPEVWGKLVEVAERKRKSLILALETGQKDDRTPLGAAQRAYFQKMLDSESLEAYPEEVPTDFLDGKCNIFGHICPVFFAAEITTETEKVRRFGRRRLSFNSMMRIVRRDDYRCQHCLKKLRDDEVEFDHIIPISKGGSSEEHNIRLTCFDCNRDKSDNYIP